MKCIVCDRCKKIIENLRQCRVITCARPLRPKAPEPPCSNKPAYHGNDPRMNDVFWEKELCDDCLNDLESFMETAPNTPPDEPSNPADPAEPKEPDTPDEGDGSTDKS